MRIDTDAARSTAAAFRACKGYAWCRTAALQSVHTQIQNSLESLAVTFTNMADNAEQAEYSLLDPRCWTDGQLQCGTSQKLDVTVQALKKGPNGQLEATLSKAWKETAFSDKSQLHSFQLEAKAASFDSGANAKLKLWDEKKFRPELAAGAHASLSLLSGSTSLMLGDAGTANITGKASGEVGAVYAKAEAVLSPETQDLELQVGAAAARGECSLAFQFFGASVTITGEGSICSAEAGFSYHHKNREWETSAKLGFIAGTGFKLNVKY